ncbi:hypothetical protein J3R83DRAFT_7155 [Lanmaoa asiatica]|nr:hypothetical protein J3R83DRAFT_7155 [Lanmaoa asiatica]
MSDPTTQSNYDAIATTDVDLDWRVDFDTQTISGSAVHRLTVLAKDGVDRVIFDTSGLEVERIEVKIGEEAAWEGVQFSIGEVHPVMGLRAERPLGSRRRCNEHAGRGGGGLSVRVTYKTRESKALQWLDPQYVSLSPSWASNGGLFYSGRQTQGKTHPYLFSQCQPIYARALVPIQGTSVLTWAGYTARVTSVLPVLMSAVRTAPSLENFPSAHDLGKKLVTYEYDQPVPIPSYFLAIASGNVVYRAFQIPEGKTWTSGVWAEPELVDAAWYEFNEDAPRFLVAEEEITINYKFGVYDLLVLPPAFPYGCMLFLWRSCGLTCSAALLTGDRSLVVVVVHPFVVWQWRHVRPSLAFLNRRFHTHSLSRHAHASHFWLNEGWTTYIERVLQERLHAPAHRGFSSLIGRKGLDDDLARYADRPKYQRLQIDFEKGEDPDDAYSDVPYEKGANFLLHIERALGGLDDLVGHFREDEDEWLFGEGLTLPSGEYDMTLALPSYALATRWDESRSTDVSELDFGPGDVAGMDTNQIIVFLERLQSELILPLPHTHIDHLGFGVRTRTYAQRGNQPAVLPSGAARGRVERCVVGCRGGRDGRRQGPDEFLQAGV